ncbi:VP3 [Eriocheir sinensis reovirus]|uniref:VP3 n=1 Tax=Eriocheir sinensis reovirus TaxID=273810 RepID=A0A0E3X9Y3_ESRV|nr:VP3 [Eriocheir sinensis reovirus]AKC01922.1 VP3 [Eriocheir sinensis reovirus]
MASTTRLVNDQKQLEERVKEDARILAEARGITITPAVNDAAIGGQEVRNIGPNEQATINALNNAIKRIEALSVTISKAERLDDAQILTPNAYTQQLEDVFSPEEDVYVVLPKLAFPDVKGVIDRRDASPTNFTFSIASQLMTKLSATTHTKIFTEYTKIAASALGPEISTEGIPLVSFIDKLDLSDAETSRLPVIQDSMVVQKGECVVGNAEQGISTIWIKRVPFVGSEFQQLIDELLWQYSTKSLTTKEQRRQRIVEMVNDRRIMIQNLTPAERPQVMRHVTTEINNGLFLKMSPVAQLYIYHLNRAFIDGVGFTPLAQKQQQLQLQLKSNILTANLIRSAINGMNTESNQEIAIKMMQAAQLRRAPLEVAFPMHVSLSPEIIVQCFIIWMSIPEELLSDRSNFTIAAVIWAGFSTDDSYADIMRRSARASDRQNYDIIKAALTSRRFRLPRAATTLVDENEPVVRRYQIGSVYAPFPVDRYGNPVYSNCNKVELASDYNAEGFTIRKDDFRALQAVLRIDEDRASDMFTTLRIIISSIPAVWYDAEVVHYPHVTVELETLAAYGLTGAYPKTNHGVSTIVKTVNNISATYSTIAQMLSTIDLDPTRYGTSESIERFKTAWENVEAILQMDGNDFVKTIMYAYEENFPKKDFYMMLKQIASDGQGAHPIAAAIDELRTIVYREPERFGYIDSVILTHNPDVDVGYNRFFHLHPVVTNQASNTIKNAELWNQMRLEMQLEFLKAGPVRVVGPFHVTYNFLSEEEDLPATSHLVMEDNLTIQQHLTFNFVKRERRNNKKRVESFRYRVSDMYVAVRISKFKLEVLRDLGDFVRPRTYLNTSKSPLATTPIRVVEYVR